MIYVREHDQCSYRETTLFNAKGSDLTIAFFVDENTSDEGLTQKAAGDKYARIDLRKSTSEAVQAIKSAFGAFDISNNSIINITGNSIGSLSKSGWNQERVNDFLATVFRGVFLNSDIKGFRSGGQSGVDIAAAVMARVLNKNAVITMPKGYLQCHLDGQDLAFEKFEIENQIEDFSRKMMAMPRVFNKKDPKIPPGAVYCGRPSVWGNDFVIGKDGDRSEVIAKFKERFLQNPKLVKRAKVELCGRDLICHCKPQACHVDVILEVANRPYL